MKKLVCVLLVFVLFSCSLFSVNAETIRVPIDYEQMTTDELLALVNSLSDVLMDRGYSVTIVENEAVEKDASENYPLKSESSNISFGNTEAITTFVYLHDKWDLYKATFISGDIIKIENWYRFTANDETPFALDHNVSTIKLSDNTTDFSWLNESNNAFSITMQDIQNPRLKEPTLVVFTAGNDVQDNLSIGYKTFTYTNDKWDLYKATQLSEDIIKIDNWYRFSASDGNPFSLDHMVMVVNIKNHSTDFTWLNDEHTSFCLTMKDEENSRLKEPTLAVFTLEE